MNRLLASLVGVAHFRLRGDGPRMLFVWSLLCVASMTAQVLGVEGIPFLHAEILILFPFLRTGIGAALAIFSVLVAYARIVQALFGFDQIFVAANLLLRNFSGFPIAYTLLIGIGFVLVLCAVAISYRRLPVKEVSVPLSALGVLMLAIALLKMSEDTVKKNILGTSFGYVAGQLRFANMFNNAYRTPGVHPPKFPGLQGADLAQKNGSNYWLIVVESLGLPVRQELRDELFKALRTQQITRRYEVSLGAVPSLGSTVHGEIRELCNGVLKDGLFGTENKHCLPSLLHEGGYITHAVHANKSSVYGRDVWYPKIGFDTIRASDTEPYLKGEKSLRWGTVLDGEVVAWSARLFDKRSPKNFVYLLTVSTHLPAALLPSATLDDQCLRVSNSHVCTHVANLTSVVRDIAAQAALLENTVVVVVGDHPPPFVSEDSRGAFSRTDVPFAILTPRPSAP